MALVPQWAGFPNWTAAHRLSGKAAILWSLLFDKDGKRFASGVPIQGAIWKGVKVYDPRLDSTYLGGSGPQRIGDESTWAWSENPGLHGLTYALGRYRNGRKVFGVGLPAAGLILQHFVDLANVCDANGWKVGGVLFEPGDRWLNLKEILQAGGAEPLFLGGRLGLRLSAPRVAVDTITDEDLADADAEIVAMQSWRERRNGLVPKYRSEPHKWDYVQSDLVSVPAYVTQDGEEKVEERQFNLVQQKNQAAQLAAYELVDGRELGPIVLPCKPRMRRYGPGDLLTLDLPEHGLDNLDAVVVDRSVDPSDMTVTLTLVTETAGKHAFALGRTGTAPPTPAITASSELDEVFGSANAQTPTLTINPKSIAVRADYTGAIAAGQLPAMSRATYQRGEADLTDSATLTINAVGCTASIDGSGVITIADAPVASTAFVDVSAPGIATPERLKIERLDGAPPSGGGSGGGAGGGSSVSRTSFGTVTSGTYPNGPAQLTLAAADATMSVTVSLAYQVSTGGATLAGKVQYRAAGATTWNDTPLGEQVGTVATGGSEPEAGALDIYDEVTGLTPGTTYEWRLELRRSAGVSTAPYGSFVVAQ